jgi:hypothetical protein
VSNGVVFKLQPSDPEIPGLIDRYQAELDKDCLAAGERIRKGDCSKENLRIIYRWKMQSYEYLGQEKKYFDRNSDEDVTRILQSTVEAVGADDPERAFNELQSLNGIGLPVASAILTAIFPDRFTVIDIMALRALNVPEGTPLSVALYLKYLTFCGSQADRLGISRRDMDRALWQWGHEHPPKKFKNSN